MEQIECCPVCESGMTVEKSIISTSQLQALWTSIGEVRVEGMFAGVKIIRFMECQDCDVNFFAPAFVGDGRFYAEFSKRRRTYYQKDKFEFEIAKGYIKPDFDVLEVGGGIGNLFRHIKCKSYTCLEINKAVIETQLKDVSFNNRPNIIEGDINEFAKQNGKKFDVVCMFQVVEHVELPGNFIKSAINCLKKDGTLLLSVPDKECFIRYLPNSLNNLPPHHQSWWSKETLKAINPDHHFDVDFLDVQQEKIVPLHYSSAIVGLIYKHAMSFLRKRSPYIITGILERYIYKVIQTVAFLLVKVGIAIKNDNGHTIIGIYRKL